MLKGPSLLLFYLLYSSKLRKCFLPFFFLDGWDGVKVDIRVKVRGWGGVKVEVDGALDGEYNRLLGLIFVSSTPAS